MYTQNVRSPTTLLDKEQWLRRKENPESTKDNYCRYKQHQPAVSCSFYLQIKRMSWKGGSKSTEHNRTGASALALLLPWCTAMASVVWRSKRCLSVVDRKWCCPKPACTSAADDCMLKVMIYKQIIALPLSLSLCWCWAEWQSFGLSWPWGPLPGVRIASYGKDWNWKGQCTDDMHVRFTCQYKSCALCSQWRGRRGKTYSVSLQSRLTWPSEKSLRNYIRVNFLLEWPSTDNWGTRKSGRKLGMMTHSALDKNFTQCWWYE